MRALLERGAARVLVVDNLLSAERENVPGRPARRASSRARSPTTRCSPRSPDDLDYVFHLATYHGNQSSIADPLADHEHNTLTTLKLYERAQGLPTRCASVVYASAGCTRGREDLRRAPRPRRRTRPVSLDLDSPYQISKIVGEYYCELLLTAARPADGQGALPERLRPGRDPRRRALARDPAHGLAQRHADLHLQGAQARGAAGRERRASPAATSSTSSDIVDGPDRAARLRGAPGDVYNLASGVETTIRELAELINELTGNPTPIALAPARDWDHSGQRFGDRRRRARELGFEAEVAAATRGSSGRSSGRARTCELIERCIAQHVHRLDEPVAPQASVA